MKKIYGFLGVAALLMTAACSKDVEGVGPNAPEASSGDMFITMNIMPATRTATEKQGSEVGKDYENSISDALLIFALKEGINNPSNDTETKTDAYKVLGYEYIESGILGGTDKTGASYNVNFKMKRQTLLDFIKAKGSGSDGEEYSDYTLDCSLFVIANPTSTMVNNAAITFAADNDVQSAFALQNDADDYWQADNFLMSNATYATVTLDYADISDLTSYNKQSSPFKLGTVILQRAMSRFDLATDSTHIHFDVETTVDNTDEATSGTTPTITYAVAVDFDAVAMINMAKEANMFKVTAKNDKYLNNRTISFMNDKASGAKAWWAYTPVQTGFLTPLFNGSVTNGKLTGEQTAFKDFFDPAKNTLYNGWTKLADIVEADNDYTPPTDAPGSVPYYYIWRYAMENSAAHNDREQDETKDQETKIANQVNGNSTGIIFRAKLSTGANDNTATVGLDPVIPTTGNEPIYAYNNVILGTADRLFTYATSPKGKADAGIYEGVHNIYKGITDKKVEENKGTDAGTWKDNEGWKVDEAGKLQKPTGDQANEKLHSIDAALVAAGFTIYKPEMVGDDVQTPVYYCYYLYWNRHNDNGENTIMGPMEFATVRNNIYKISVNNVIRLGHPGTPDGDPDKPKPEDPDEEDEFWAEFICEILDWEVRITGLDF